MSGVLTVPFINRFLLEPKRRNASLAGIDYQCLRIAEQPELGGPAQLNDAVYESVTV
jgi:hypothetical protein